MTPEEAIEIIWERHMDCEDYLSLFDSYPDGYDFGFDQAILIAAQAIEEVQQYRAIGTVEECKELVSIVNMAEKNELAKVIDEWLKYSKIGTVEECREAREKQIPKKPLLKSKKKKITIGNYIYVTCPSCGETIFSCFLFFPWNETQCSHRYCENCGQAIDWSTDDLEGMKDERD